MSPIDCALVSAGFAVFAGMFYVLALLERRSARLSARQAQRSLDILDQHVRDHLDNNNRFLEEYTRRGRESRREWERLARAWGVTLPKETPPS